MKRSLAILFVCLPVLASDTSPLYPPGYKPVLQSPKAAGEMKNAAMVKTVAAGPLSPVELVFAWKEAPGVGRIPDLRLRFLTNAPHATVWSQVWSTTTNCPPWTCTGQIDDVRAGQVREFGWCARDCEPALFLRVVLHD